LIFRKRGVVGFAKRRKKSSDLLDRMKAKLAMTWFMGGMLASFFGYASYVGLSFF